MLIVVKWTFWGDPQYPEVEWAGEEADHPYEQAAIDAIRKHGYRFSGQVHQHAQYGVPVMSDGKQYNVSMRHWGQIMIKAYGIEGEHAYTVWAWFPPEDEECIMPTPEEWGDSPEENVEQEQRWLSHERAWLQDELSGFDNMPTRKRMDAKTYTATCMMRMMLRRFAQDNGITEEEAEQAFLQSKTHEALFDFDTEIWKEGPDYLRDWYDEELRDRKP